MAKIYKYRKITDRYTTHTLVEPDHAATGNGERITEICAIDGWTYVSVPDTMVLPDQPDIISETLQKVDLEKESAAIIAASPVCQSISGRVVDMIRERYTVNDEIKMLRIGPSDETSEYNDYVEACRAWGREEKARLGL